MFSWQRYERYANIYLPPGVFDLDVLLLRAFRSRRVVVKILFAIRRSLALRDRVKQVINCSPKIGG